MALVDTLPYVPEHDPHHAILLAYVAARCAAVLKAQDVPSSLWYQILDQPGVKGNYIESSSVLMFTYAFAKGSRLGYLPAPTVTLQGCMEGHPGTLCAHHGVGTDGDHRYGHARRARRYSRR